MMVMVSRMPMMVMMMMRPASPIATIPIARTIPTAIIPRRMPTPTHGIVEAPVPPQAVGIGRERIGIESVIEHIPFPRRKHIDHFPIKRTAHRDGITRIAETDNAHGIFIVALRTFETIDPLAPFIVRLFFDIQRIILHRERIVT